MRAPEIIERLKGGERVQFPAEWLDVFFADASRILGTTRLEVVIDNGVATLAVLPTAPNSAQGAA